MSKIIIHNYAHVEVDGEDRGNLVMFIRSSKTPEIEIVAALNAYDGQFNIARERAVESAVDAMQTQHDAAIAAVRAEYEQRMANNAVASDAIETEFDKLKAELEAVKAERDQLAGSDLPSARRALAVAAVEERRAELAAAEQQLADLDGDGKPG